MLKSWGETRHLLERLRADEGGMASFEYILVAFCIIGAVGAAFGAGAGGGAITTALTSGIATIAALLPAAA
jgi:pilus assembly protein Flp/PilA